MGACQLAVTCDENEQDVSTARNVITDKQEVAPPPRVRPPTPVLWTRLATVARPTPMTVIGASASATHQE